MRSVDAHVAECLAGVVVLPAVEVPLLDALDLVLAEPVTSPVDLPPFGNSSMDGYAVRLPDVAEAGGGRPVRLPVAADLPAGIASVPVLRPGSVARIMTGAPVPEGADAVVPVEWTDAGTRVGEIRRAPESGQYVRRAGEDVHAGEVVLQAGVRLGPRHLALLAAVGRAAVTVHPRPRVAVLSTGSELTSPGEPLAPGRIHDANGYGLVAAARDLGADAWHAGVVPDRADAVLAALREAAAAADVVITSGGVSAGAYDTVKQVLREVGGVVFEKVAMQPGMPQGFGRLAAPDGRRLPILTLPGNPVSAMVSFELFVHPLLRTLAGEASVHRRAVIARAATGWPSPAGKRQFVRAVLETGGDGGRSVRPVGGQGSHLVADLAEADCLAVVPEEVTRVSAGDELTCLLLERGRR